MKENQDGADKSNLFPDSQKGRLDYELLKKMGLTKERITKRDALFFKQLNYLMIDPQRSGIENYQHLSYYTSIENSCQNMPVTLV